MWVVLVIAHIIFVLFGLLAVLFCDPEAEYSGYPAGWILIVFGLLSLLVIAQCSPRPVVRDWALPSCQMEQKQMTVISRKASNWFICSSSNSNATKD